MARIINTKDKLSWLLRLPVMLIWLDQEQQILRWQMSSLSVVVLMLPHEA